MSTQGEKILFFLSLQVCLLGTNLSQFQILLFKCLWQGVWRRNRNSPVSCWYLAVVDSCCISLSVHVTLRKCIMKPYCLCRSHPTPKKEEYFHMSNLLLLILLQPEMDQNRWEKLRAVHVTQICVAPLAWQNVIVSRTQPAKIVHKWGSLELDHSVNKGLCFHWLSPHFVRFQQKQVGDRAPWQQDTFSGVPVPLQPGGSRNSSRADLVGKLPLVTLPLSLICCCHSRRWCYFCSSLACEPC